MTALTVQAAVSAGIGALGELPPVDAVFGFNVVDWIIVAAVVLFAFLGWRSGFVQGVASLLGFLAGAAIALRFLPGVIERFNIAPPLSALLLILGLLILGVIGQVLASSLGDWIMKAIGIAPVRWINSAAGMVLYALAALVIAGMLASLLSTVGGDGIKTSLSRSRLVPMIDDALPQPVRDFIEGRAGNGTGTLPSILSGLTQQTPEVAPPSPGVAGRPGVRAALPSVVQVFGETPECGGGTTGSGYVSAPGQVTTNAHVVAGVRSPRVEAPGVSGSLEAAVVAFDPKQDVAVLRVPGLAAKPLEVGAPANTGQNVVAVGYPNGGEMKVAPGRVRSRLDSGQWLGTDIYGKGSVARDIYVFRGVVRPGDSGGPLLRGNGTVIGMVYAQGVEDKRTGFAITAEEVAATQAAAAGRTTPLTTGTCLATLE